MLLSLLYRIIGDFFSYIGDIGGTTMAAIQDIYDKYPQSFVYDGLFEIAGQLKIDFQKLILGKVLIFMKFFENVFCYFRYSLNLVF